MADRLPQEYVQVLIAHACPVCLEDISGPTTRAAAEAGLKFEEIFYQADSVVSRAYGGPVFNFVHRCHLN